MPTWPPRSSAASAARSTRSRCRSRASKRPSSGAPRTMPEFGDRVRILTSADTEAAGVSGRVGIVMGFTTPSLGFVAEPIIGIVVDDSAIAVMLDGEETSRWFGTDLVEFVDHGPGTTIRVGDVELEREADGSWTKPDR